MTRHKRNKKPELARWKYNVQIDVEETLRNAEIYGFSCRLLEGQAKNRRGKNGWGEHFPLNQCEIRGGGLPLNSKVQVSPKATQIFFFGNEIPNPLSDNLTELNRFLDGMEPVVADLAKTERLMNALAVFVPGERKRFGLSTRICVKVPSMYRLNQGFDDTIRYALDSVQMNLYTELEKVCVEIFQGKMDSASSRLDVLARELTFFQQDLFNRSKELMDVLAEQRILDLKKEVLFPSGVSNYGRFYKKEKDTEGT